MKIVNPEYQILTPINGEEILKHIELAGRNCYKTESSISDDSYEDFVRRIINNGHLSVIEHYSISVRIITSVAITRELNRHRHLSISESSTRYCNFSKDRFGNEITVISPHWKNNESKDNYNYWKDSMEMCETVYFHLIRGGMKPENARGVLPLDLKTECIYTGNLREWAWVFEMRCSSKAHPELRRITIPLCTELHKKIPVIFDEVYEKYCSRLN